MMKSDYFFYKRSWMTSKTYLCFSSARPYNGNLCFVGVISAIPYDGLGNLMHLLSYAALGVLQPGEGRWPKSRWAHRPVTHC